MFVLRTSSIIPKIPKCFTRLNISSYHHLKQICRKDFPLLMASTTHHQHQTNTMKKAPDFKPLYNIDKINPRCELIYNYGQDFYYWSMFFHFFTVPVCLSTVYSFGIDLMNSETLTMAHLAPPVKILISVYLTVFVNRMMRRFINRIYFDPETQTYTAIHIDWNFKFQRLEFTPKDCKIVETRYGQGNLQIKEKIFSLNVYNFKYPSHFEKIFSRPSNVTKGVNERNVEKKTMWQIKEMQRQKKNK